MELSTRYLGLRLAHPFMPGASPLADDLDMVLRLEDAGASAIVMRSMFEEQIAWEGFRGFERVGRLKPAPEALPSLGASATFALNPDRYLRQLVQIKQRVGVPVIASLNSTIAERWLDYARLIDEAGADALELNFYHVVTDPLEDSATVERRMLDIVAVVTELVSLPVAVKLLPFYSSLPHLAVELHALGVGGLVLFNRFWQPGIDPERSQSASQAQLSDSSELQLRLQWLAILFGRVRTSLAASGGVHEPRDAVRAVLAGADVVQLVSCLLRHGPEYLHHIRLEFEQWGQQHEYASIEQIRERASIASQANPEQFERDSLIRPLQSWRRPGS